MLSQQYCPLGVIECRTFTMYVLMTFAGVELDQL